MISELSATISEDEADLKAATAIREKEHKSFTAEEAELMSATDMLGRAITIIEREMKGSSLIQTKLNFQNLNGWVQALKTLLDATSISTSDKKEKADAQLAELRKVEKTDAHNFDLLKISIDDALAANNKELDENKAAKAEAEELLAATNGELDITNKALAEATAGQDVVHEDCMEKASDHEITVQGRKEELAALAKAKKIIQQMTAGATKQSYSFIQTSSLTRAESA